MAPRAFGPPVESNGPLFSDSNIVPILHPYHYTFEEFLRVKTRAGELWVDPANVDQYIISCCWSHIDRIRPRVTEGISEERERQEVEGLFISCAWFLWFMMMHCSDLGDPLHHGELFRRFVDLNLWNWLALDAAPWSLEVHFCVAIRSCEV
ncbi:hypothetical protein DFP72DRAFT_910801 [Ephemerocybe angulata]|uniref:Uncharacterized protein n=1 Tax=Ephemerocybe angulata TaxID=980116 RepID=A0A8H6M2Z5_9AGAR|nr:hypothetical protein DFP72DRAFT_910801 [Tulosesus angulatus]